MTPSDFCLQEEAVIITPKKKMNIFYGIF